MQIRTENHAQEQRTGCSYPVETFEELGPNGRVYCSRVRWGEQETQASVARTVREGKQDIHVFRRRCRAMFESNPEDTQYATGSFDEWAGMCMMWMNRHLTFGGNNTKEKVKRALRAVIDSMGGDRKFEKLEGWPNIDRQEEHAASDDPQRWQRYEEFYRDLEHHWAAGARILAGKAG